MINSETEAKLRTAWAERQLRIRLRLEDLGGVRATVLSSGDLDFTPLRVRVSLRRNNKRKKRAAAKEGNS